MGAETQETIDGLIKEGTKIAYLADEALFGHKDAERSSDVFSKYTIWKIKVLDFSKEVKNLKLQAIVSQTDGVTDLFSLAVNDKVSMQGMRVAIPGGSGTHEIEEETTRQLTALKLGIQARQDALTNVHNVTGGGSGTIQIVINQTKQEVSVLGENEAVEKCSFRRRNNKRFGYLVRVIQNPKISGEELGQGVTPQGLSGEIKKINGKIKETLLKLGLPTANKFIVNDGNSGYYIHPVFAVTLIS